MNTQYREEKAKLKAIEKAVLSGVPDEAVRLYQELHNPFLTARILGIAGRFAGVDMVKALVESGVSFGYETRIDYDLYYDFGTHYLMLLPDFFILFLLKGVDRIKGYFAPNRKMNELVDSEGKPLMPLCEEERIQVIEYLCEQEGKLCLFSGDYLYYAILTDERNIANALKEKGICFSNEIKEMLTEGGGNENDRWTMYWYFLGTLSDNTLAHVLSALHTEIGEEKKLHFTEKLWRINSQRFLIPEFFMVFLQHFNQSEMNKKRILGEIIDNERVSCLKIVEDYGWLKDIRRRDELIAYASENHKIESAAWLLDFKNRTVDLAAEQRKAEKKLMRELNMAPDSVTILRKLWRYEKKEDGTLAITNYKGKEIEVTVPEKIGKGIVTVIGYGAFTGNTGFTSVYTRQEQIEQHGKITKIILPKTLRKVEKYAFRNMSSLQEIMIADGLEELGIGAFWACESLKSLTIPGTVKRIGACAFFHCKKLECVHICEGVLEIGGNAFLGCSDLKEVILPSSVQRLTSVFNKFNEGDEIFSGCPNLIISCPKGSKAEDYCKEKGFRFQYTTE